MPTLNSHFEDVLHALKVALAQRGAPLPISDDDPVNGIFQNNEKVADIVNRTFFPGGGGIDANQIGNLTIADLADRIVDLQNSNR
jgi:hypothetical protein